MSQSSFFIGLSATTLLTAILLFFLLRFPEYQSATAISWSSLAVFVIISLGMYFIGLNSLSSSNKNAFTGVILISIMVKMFLSIMIIIGYLQLAKPETKLFVVPFLGIYLIFTVFETYFMMKLSKMKK